MSEYPTFDDYEREAEEQLTARTPASCSPDAVELIEQCRRIAEYSETYRSGVAASCLRQAADALESMMRREDATFEERLDRMEAAWPDAYAHNSIRNTCRDLLRAALEGEQPNAR